MEQIRVMIIDDHPVVRKGLKSLLSQYSDITVVDESDGGQEVMKSVDEAKPDIILLDIRLAGRSGLRLARQFKQSYPQIRIIILTSYEDKDYLLQSVKIGVRGYVLKTASAELLTEVIRKVHSGERYLSPSMIGIVLEQFEASDQVSARLQSGLSEEELTLLKLIADGSTSQEIAQTLYISERSVKRKIQSVLEKLEAANRAQAVSEGYKRGLL